MDNIIVTKISYIKALDEFFKKYKERGLNLSNTMSHTKALDDFFDKM